MRVFFHPQNADEVWVTSFGNGMKVGNAEVSGLFTLENQPELIIFPNPASNSFSLKTSGNAQSFQVFDQQGNTVLKGKINQQTMIDSHSLVPGMYFISVDYDNGITATEKIIILPNH